MANAMLQHDSEKERFQKLITDTICMLCKSSFSTQPRITVDGLLGITLSSDEVFLVKINQTITNDYISSPAKSVKEEAASPNDEITPPVFPMSKTSIFGSRRSQPTSKPESRIEDVSQDDDEDEEEEEEGLEDNKLIIDHEKENEETNCKNDEASAPNSTSTSSTTTSTSSSSSTSQNAIPFENLLKVSKFIVIYKYIVMSIKCECNSEYKIIYGINLYELNISCIQ